MHTGTIQKSKSFGGIISLAIVTLVIIGFLLSPIPHKSEVKGSTIVEKTWLDEIKEFLEKAGAEDKVVRKTIHPTQQKWRICWEEPAKAKGWNPEKKAAPCAPGANVKRVVKIKEYNSARFVFTVSWKERGVFKERALFTWDKIANPKHGTWHQLGSKHKDSGEWRLVKRDSMFVGWHSSKVHKQQFMTTLEVGP